MTDILRTPYVCQSCSAIKQREHTASDVPLTGRWRAKCISPKCRGKKRIFYPAKRPLTGPYTYETKAKFDGTRTGRFGVRK